MRRGVSRIAVVALLCAVLAAPVVWAQPAQAQPAPSVQVPWLAEAVGWLRSLVPTPAHRPTTDGAPPPQDSGNGSDQGPSIDPDG
jgi:hypothetical protein